jgi:hypothetical protein
MYLLERGDHETPRDEKLSSEIIRCSFCAPVVPKEFSLLDVDMETVVMLEQVVTEFVRDREVSTVVMVLFVHANDSSVTVFKDESGQLLWELPLEHENATESGETVDLYWWTFDAALVDQLLGCLRRLLRFDLNFKGRPSCGFGFVDEAVQCRLKIAAGEPLSSEAVAQTYGLASQN